MAAFGLLATFLMMANSGRLPHGPLLGALAMALGIFGLLGSLGLLGAEGATERLLEIFESKEGEPRAFAPAIALPLAAAVVGIAALLGGYAFLPGGILAGLLVLLAPALRRPALLVFVAVAAVHLPWLGAYGLWDPWETHYGEVAREILSRDDWISLFWAHEDWFWSKPILIFWSEALSMGALGVDYRPDANPAHPEWALRLPIFLMSMGAVLATYAAIGRIFGKRAGILAAIVMATMPHFFFLSHQAITDMPFVSTMTIAICLLVLALVEDPEREVRRYRLGRVEVSAQHAMLGALLLAALPQALYLLSRNVTILAGPAFAWHRDRFFMGSGGNPSVPGITPLHEVGPVFGALWAQPSVQAALWLVGIVVLVQLVRRDRKAQSLLMTGFYFFCALSFMGKGIPGFALPGLVAFLYLLASKRWELLLGGNLRVARGMLIIAVVGLPWYVAMYFRHGAPFLDRLLVHDHINRLAAGVHGDNGSIQYFLLQLGYGTFPWVGLVPAAAVAWLWYHRRSALPIVPASSVGALRQSADPAWTGDETDARDAYHRRETLVLLGLWFLAAFTLFSAMITKFHHYIFPAVPAAGMLVGILLDRTMGGDEASSSRDRLLATVFALVSPVLFVLGVAGLFGDPRGLAPVDLPSAESVDWVVRHPWPLPIAGSLIALGGLFFAASLRLRTKASSALEASDVALSAMLAAGAVLVAFVARDLSWETASRPQGYERLIHLFVYNYGRPWPEGFDYRPILTGFGVGATALFGLAALRRLRGVASHALLGLALAFAAWALDVYMIDLSPHWGQREIIKRYYEERKGPEEPLLAWQMNWKGENFYTGNRVYTFVQLDNKALREWMATHRGKRAFFVLEHSRLGSFKNVVKTPIREVTTKRDNNKFLIVESTL